MTRTVDFDAFRAERDDEPVEILIGGERYQLPASLPAIIAIDMIHLKSTTDAGAEVSVEMLNKVGNSVFGEDVWRELLGKHRIQVDELGELIQMVLKVYSPGAEEDPTVAST